MKRFILIILCIFVLHPIYASGADYVMEKINLRPAKTVFLPKGSLVKVYNVKQFSSQFTDEDDEITLLNASDVYIGETNVIPEKSVFYGSVEKVMEPVQGTNGALKIKILKVVTPEGISYPLSGYLSPNGSDTVLGGGRTPALYYTRMPHYSTWKLTKWRVGAAQYCETNTRQFGTHTVVKPGAELFIILQDNFYIQ